MEMTVTHKDGSVLAHKFEAAGLGIAPFKYIGVKENVIIHPDGRQQAGGMCDYCGNGIRYEYHIKDSAGKQFKVGSECVRHAFNDEALTVKIESEVRRLKREKAAAKREAKRQAEIEEAKSLSGEYESALAKLENKPHPHPYFAEQGKTKADYYRYFGNLDLMRIKQAIREAQQTA